MDRKDKIRLDQAISEDKKQSRFDYEITGFMLKKPYHRTIVKGPIRLTGRDAHRKLVEKACAAGLYVWYGRIAEIDGKPHVIEPHIVDFDSVPNVASDRGVSKSELSGDGDFKCNKCGKICSSSSGLTLHMKNCSGEHAQIETELECPICHKKCSSTSGLTLHRQSAHKEELAST